jgi:hypothetical protein
MSSINWPTVPTLNIIKTKNYQPLVNQIERTSEEHEVLEREWERYPGQLPLCFLNKKIIRFGRIYRLGN